MMKTIQVTINPDGKTARWISQSGKIIKYEISGSPLEDLLKDFQERVPGIIEHTHIKYKPGAIVTAEILETYPEPVGNVHGRCKILS